MKADARAPQGFQLNIEVPKEPMEVLHIDLTEVNGKFFMTVVDRFSKRGWFVFFNSHRCKVCSCSFLQQDCDLVGIAQSNHQRQRC